MNKLKAHQGGLQHNDVCAQYILASASVNHFWVCHNPLPTWLKCGSDSLCVVFLVGKYLQSEECKYFMSAKRPQW